MNGQINMKQLNRPTSKNSGKTRRHALLDQQINKQTDLLTNRQKNKLTNKQTAKQTN